MIIKELRPLFLEAKKYRAYTMQYRRIIFDAYKVAYESFSELYPSIEIDKEVLLEDLFLTRKNLSAFI